MSGEVPGQATGAALLRLVEVMDTLRVSCPWDAKQTHSSLAPYMLEECYEALEALESGDPAALADELGDVLLQVLFHARIASEAGPGGFTIDDIATGTVDKLTRRHPHVFAGAEAADADEVKRNWDQIKAAERAAAGTATASSVDSVPFGQPALALAAQLQRRARRAGVPADLAPAGTGVSEFGLALFALVATACEAGLDPEMELRAAARAYASAVRDWERGNADGAGG